MLVSETTKAEVKDNSTFAPAAANAPLLAHPDQFQRRHVGPSPEETAQMLDASGFQTLNALIDEAVPEHIRLKRALNLPPARTEFETLATLKGIAAQNQVYRS